MSLDVVAVAHDFVPADLSTLDRLTVEVLVSACAERLEADLPESLELLYLDVGLVRRHSVARRLPPTQQECRRPSP